MDAPELAVTNGLMTGQMDALLWRMSVNTSPRASLSNGGVMRMSMTPEKKYRRLW